MCSDSFISTNNVTLKRIFQIHTHLVPLSKTQFNDSYQFVQIIPETFAITYTLVISITVNEGWYYFVTV